MKKIVSLLLAVITVATLLCSCSLSAKVTRGTIDGSTYTNESVGITFSKPYGWEFYSDDEIAELMNVTKDELDDEDLINSIDVAVVMDFVAATKTGKDSVNMVIENLKASGNGLISVKRYLQISKKTLAEQFPDATFSETEKVMLGSTEFWMISLEVKYGIEYMDQYIYVKKVGTHMIVITATTMTDKTSEDFEDMFY